MSEHAGESDGSDLADTHALVSRLRVIEDQPLDQRAEAFGQLYDELRARLESSDAAPHE